MLAFFRPRRRPFVCSGFAGAPIRREAHRSGGVWGLAGSLLAALTSAAWGDGPPVPGGPSPPIWGYAGTSFYPAGSHEAPNGLRYDPLLSLDSDLNIGLMPDKYLYLFMQSGLTVERSGGVNPRELDADYGIAWNYWNSLELRALGYSNNNLNRGISLTSPGGYTDGISLENQYYFGPANPYDVGRLDFVSIGAAPFKSWLEGLNGQQFRPGPFAELHLTHDLAVPWHPYLYGDLRLTAANDVSPRLLDTDVGVAVRPLDSWQDLELRLGYKRTDDFKAGTPENVVYAAARIDFGITPAPPPGGSAAGSASPALWSLLPDIWGTASIPFYPTGSRMAPNGRPFTPIFGLNSELNVGLLPQKQAYLFWDGAFWAQHSGNGVTNSGQGGFDFSRREADSELGAAWNYYDSLELRSSFYMLNNLNRGTSPLNEYGEKDGLKLENRYYLPTASPYDLGRLDFVSLGYVPAGDMVNNAGANFHPGAFARAYLTADLPVMWWPNYVFGDMQAMAQSVVTPQLLDGDFGWAVRPFDGWRNLEFRVGSTVSDDLHGRAAVRDTAYVAVRINFDPTGFVSAAPPR
jgi:hypothetical protein